MASESEGGGGEGGEYLPSDLDEEAFLAAAYATDEDAYLQGATTAEEDDDEEAPDFFGADGDPLSLLEGMQAQEALGRQPYQLLASRRQEARRQRRAAVAEGRSAAAAAAGEGDEEAEEEVDGEDGEEARQEGGGDGAGPSRRPQQVQQAAAAQAQQEQAPALQPSGKQRPRRRSQAGQGAAFGAAVDEIFDEGLAEQMGLQPAVSRKKQRARERWRKKADAQGRRRRDIPEDVAAKLGEANLLYATGRHHEAIARLMEVIRMAPNLPDPYHTLGLLHEAVGDTKKALDFFMIAVHLTPRDLSLWKRLAAMSTDAGLIRQAIYCYTQILRRDREDLDARYDRAMLYADMGESRKAIEGLEQVQAARPDHGEVPKALARLYHRVGQAPRAVALLQAHIAAYPAQTDLTHINILAELYCDAGQWRDALAAVQHAEAALLGPGEELPVDLRVKAGAAHAYLGDVAAAVDAFTPILEEPVDSFADLYLDAAAVLMAAGQPERALPFLTALAEHPDSTGPEVWSRLALCHRALDDAEAALNVYQSVVAQLGPDHPGHIEAVVALADLHRELGQQAEAERVLGELEQLIRSQDTPADHAAAYEFVLRRANVLYACGKNEAYLDVTLPVLGATLRTLEAEHRQVAGLGTDAERRLAKRLKYLGAKRREGGGQAEDQEGVFVGYRRADRRKAHIRELDERAEALLRERAAMSGAESEGEEEGGPGAFVMRELLKEEAPFSLLLQTGQVLLAERQHREARELLQAALDVCGRRWTDKWKKDAVRLLIFEAALGQRDFTAAMQSLRPVTARWPFSQLVWNGFSRYLAETGGVRAALKFLTPLRARHPSCLPLMLMLGHCHLLNAQYGEALGEYFHAYRVAPTEPLVLLCIAAGLVNQAASKRGGAPDRHRAVLQAFAFLQEYSDRRRNPQEAAYNIGRAAHQLGLLHIAAPYYQRVLEAGPPPGAPASAGPAAYDLRREAAFNLSLIYKASGAAPLARALLRQHLTV